VSCLSAAKAESLFETLFSLRGGKFRNADSVDIHGIRVSFLGRGGVDRRERVDEGTSFVLLGGKESSTLLVVDPLNVGVPFSDGGGDFLHKVDLSG
jgi:hypothetical protein